MRNNIVEKKETFFDYKENIFNFLKIAFFHAFSQKMLFFSLFVFAKNNTRSKG